MLEARELSRRYGSILALDKLNLSVAPGQIFGLLGHNGAGKTTTIKLMTGLLKPTSGTVIVGGHDIQTEPLEAKRLIGYVADEPHLYEKLTPVEFMRFNGELYGVEPAELPGRIDRLLSLFDLTARANTLIEGFSHGMKQKTALAGALVHDPAVLFLDEPTVGLDPRGARMLKEVLRRLASRGMTVVLSTHILEIAERLCDRVAILYKGRLAATGTIDELKRSTGEKTLEEIFLEMTGGDDLDELLASFETP
jgi:ABC-2 type transport system ATP-binding protein